MSRKGKSIEIGSRFSNCLGWDGNGEWGALLHTWLFEDVDDTSQNRGGWWGGPGAHLSEDSEAWLRVQLCLLLSAVWAHVLAFLISFPPVKDNITEAPLSSVLSPLPWLGGSPWGLQPVWGGEAGLGRLA